MAKRYLSFWLISVLFLGSAWTVAQDNETRLRVNVNLVQLNVAVTDHKGTMLPVFALRISPLPRIGFQRRSRPLKQAMSPPVP